MPDGDVITEVERFLAGGTDRRILFIAASTVETVVSVSERSVDQVRLTVGAHETLLMPVSVLETHVLC